MAEAYNWRSLPGYLNKYFDECIANKEEDGIASSSNMEPSTSSGQGSKMKFTFSIGMPMRGEQIQTEAQSSSRDRMRTPTREFGCPSGECEYKATSKVMNYIIYKDWQKGVDVC